MRFIKAYSEMNENKMWYKTIPQMLDWLESKSNIPWVFLDTETTGLNGPIKEQITQIAAIFTNYNYNLNEFYEVDRFDHKIKLNSDIKSRYNNEDDRTKWVLSFNHYGAGNYKYRNEKEVIDDFFDKVNTYSPCLLVAQNTFFDMSMLGGRYNNKIKDEVFDTKELIQLYYIPLLQTLAEDNIEFENIINSIGTSERDNGLLSSSLSKIGPALGINMVGYHDALVDCRLMMDMYIKIVDFLKEYKNVDITRYQLERIKVLR